MTISIPCVPSSRLTDEQLALLSAAFNHHARPQLIEMRRIMGDSTAAFRSFSKGTVSFDREALLKAVSFKVSIKSGERLALLLDQGVCPQAIARTNLKIPLTAGSAITMQE